MADAPVPRRVLCVEDNPEVRELVATILDEFEMVFASGVANGWRLFNDAKYSLIVLDYSLDDGTGTQLCERIRAIDMQTPIVFISGHPDITEIQIKMVGAQRLIPKARFDFVELLSSVVNELAV